MSHSSKTRLLYSSISLLYLAKMTRKKRQCIFPSKVFLLRLHKAAAPRLLPPTRRSAGAAVISLLWRAD